MSRALLILLLLITPVAVASAEQPVNIGSRLELMIDDYLIEETRGSARLQLNKPVRREIALVTDAPWEGNACAYRAVFQDGDLYRMYYGGYHYNVMQGKQTYPHSRFLCYAESRDGIRWVKPELGLVELDNWKSNNIVLSANVIDKFQFQPDHTAVFKDSNPNCDAAARYKGIAAQYRETVLGQRIRGLYALQSADGIQFTAMRDEPILTESEGVFDSQNLAFWDTTRGEYRIYFRGFREGVRTIRTATSQDFLHWTSSEELKFPGAPFEHLYTNTVKPYSRAPHILVGFPMRYTDRGWQHSTGKLPHPDLRRLRSSVSPRFGSAVTDALIMTSRDGVTFKRWGEAFIRPGPARTNSWVYGDNIPAWGIVQTKSDVPESPDELSIYANEGYWTGKGVNVRRYSMRLDGFVSAHAALSGGEVLTKPLTFQGNQLVVNYSTSAAGGLWIEVQNADGEPLRGFTESDCHEIFGDEVERSVHWREGTDLSSLEGKPVRLRFILKDADLYSFRFR